MAVMVVRMRSTRSHRNNRRSHFSLSAPRLSTCISCGKMKQAHALCLSCGAYRGRKIIDLNAKREKKLEKRKERAKAGVK